MRYLCPFGHIFVPRATVPDSAGLRELLVPFAGCSDDRAGFPGGAHVFVVRPERTASHPDRETEFCSSGPGPHARASLHLSGPLAPAGGRSAVWVWLLSSYVPSGTQFMPTSKLFHFLPPATLLTSEIHNRKEVPRQQRHERIAWAPLQNWGHLSPHLKLLAGLSSSREWKTP